MADKQRAEIYTVATAHLDTSWNWELETTVREYLPATLDENFKLFAEYPDYVFNFEGAYRYELIEEYYPEKFAALTRYIADGRWNVAGGAYESGDVNIPSPEALFRNLLLGSAYFREKFGVSCSEIFLPDCFGFGFALPSVAAHAGLCGFVTQKLPWSCAYGIPFDTGKWYGVDGKYIFACFDGMDYAHSLRRVRKYHHIKTKLSENSRRFGLPFALVFHGVGDRGGAPSKSSVAAVCAELARNSRESSDVLSAASGSIFTDMAALPEAVKERLPEWRGELVAADHGAAAYTSRAIAKRWNRRCEQLADMAERVSVFAEHFGAAEYPRRALDTAWKRVVAHQFHDDITGTSTLECCRRGFNDYVLSMNQFASELDASARALCALADTSWTRGAAAVVFNTLQSDGERSACVEARVVLPEDTESVAAFAEDGSELPARIVSREGNSFLVAFGADVPSVGFAVFDIRPSRAKREASRAVLLPEGGAALENGRFTVTLNADGDISGIYDKLSGREALSAPIRLAVLPCEGRARYPAWELAYEDISAPPLGYFAAPEFEVLRGGGARVSVRVRKSFGSSTLIQTVSLSDGEEYVETQNELDWRELRSMAKQVFPLAASNPAASYDLGLGVIERKNSSRELYEFPAQQWADITDADGDFGISVFSDSKIGWDKPSDDTLRMTVVHTPRYRYRDTSRQHLLDLGLNRFGFAIYPHEGPVGGGTQLNAAYFHAPMTAFACDRHEGVLGARYSFAGISSPNVMIRAIKKAHSSDGVVVRFNEGAGKPAEKVRFTLGGGIAEAVEIYADERPVAPAGTQEGELVFDLPPYGVRSFLLTPVPAGTFAAPARCESVELPFNVCAVSSNGENVEGALPGGETLPAELFPGKLLSGGVSFTAATGRLNAVKCASQRLVLPEGAQSLFVLAASTRGDREAVFRAGETRRSVMVSDIYERVGAWDLLAAGETGRIKRDALAWNATHVHRAGGDVVCKQAYIFKYEIPLDGERELELPGDDGILIFAASVVSGMPRAAACSELYDSLDARPLDFTLTREQEAEADAPRSVRRREDMRFKLRYARIRLGRELARFGRRAERSP